MESGSFENAPEPAKAPQAVHAEFPTCDNCAAMVRWAPEEGALHCDHCNTGRPVPSSPEMVRELDLVAEYHRAPTGFGLRMRTLCCQSCGATVDLGREVTATRCTFCHSPQVVEQNIAEDVIRPASLLPMRISQREARKCFRTWLSRLWFRPNSLGKAGLQHLLGVYVPYWTFDAWVDSHWTAESGTYYWVTQTYTTIVNGKVSIQTRQVRKVRWWPSSGERRDRHDDVLVCGSRSLPPKLVARLDTFHTDSLLPYHPHYLAGFRAERYTKGLRESHVGGRRIMEQRQHRLCSGDVPGDTHRSLIVANEFHHESFKHLLLPIWFLAYTWKGKVYRVLVNGQTGEVEGEAPLSVLKILGLVLLGLALVGGVLLLVTY